MGGGARITLLREQQRFDDGHGLAQVGLHALPRGVVRCAVASVRGQAPPGRQAQGQPVQSGPQQRVRRPVGGVRAPGGRGTHRRAQLLERLCLRPLVVRGEARGQQPVQVEAQQAQAAGSRRHGVVGHRAENQERTNALTLLPAPGYATLPTHPLLLETLLPLNSALAFGPFVGALLPSGRRTPPRGPSPIAQPVGPTRLAIRKAVYIFECSLLFIAILFSIMLPSEPSGPAVHYHRVSRAEQRLILLHDLPVDAKRVALASRPRPTARGVVYDGVVSWELHRPGTHVHPETGVAEPVVVETRFSRFLGASPVDWLDEAAREMAAVLAPSV